MSLQKNEVQTSVTTFFTKSKHHEDFSDKNQFIQNKLNGAIENTHAEPNQNEHNKIREGGENQIRFPVNDIDNDDQILILTGRIRVLEKDLKDAKILLRKASDLNLQKDLEIKVLKERLNKKKVNEKKNEILFQNHSHRFKPDEMKDIRSTRAGKTNDSTFVSTILKCLYKNEEAKLNDRRVTARKYDGTKKIELSAEKKEIMREMLEERVTNELDTSYEEDELKTRLKKLNTHLRNALHSSLTAHKKSLAQILPVSTSSQPIQSQTDRAQPQTTPFQSAPHQHYSYPYDPYIQYQPIPFSQTIHPRVARYRGAT